MPQSFAVSFIADCDSVVRKLTTRNYFCPVNDENTANQITFENK